MLQLVFYLGRKVYKIVDVCGLKIATSSVHILHSKAEGKSHRTNHLKLFFNWSNTKTSAQLSSMCVWPSCLHLWICLPTNTTSIGSVLSRGPHRLHCHCAELNFVHNILPVNPSETLNTIHFV